MRKWEVAGDGRGLVGLAGYVADVGDGSSGVDINGSSGLWCQVDVAGPAVVDGSVGETDRLRGRDWNGTKTRSRRQQN